MYKYIHEYMNCGKGCSFIHRNGTRWKYHANSKLGHATNGWFTNIDPDVQKFLQLTMVEVCYTMSTQRNRLPVLRGTWQDWCLFLKMFLSWGSRWLAHPFYVCVYFYNLLQIACVEGILFSHKFSSKDCVSELHIYLDQALIKRFFFKYLSSQSTRQV